MIGVRDGVADLDLGSIPDASLLLLADILPTGYFAARNALKSRNLEHLNDGRKHLRFAVVGLGPVGLVRPDPRYFEVLMDGHLIWVLRISSLFVVHGDQRISHTEAPPAGRASSWFQHPPRGHERGSEVERAEANRAHVI